MKSGSKFFTLHSSLFTCRRHYPSSSPPVVPPPWLPPWLSPPSVMSSSPDAAAAACGSTFCQLTSSENWRLNLAATVQPSRLFPLAAFSISAVATFRVPSPSGDGYRSALPLATEGTQECRGIYCPLASCAPLVLRRAELGVRRNPVWRDSSNVKRERAVWDGYGIEGMSSDSGILLGIILNFSHCYLPFYLLDNNFSFYGFNFTKKRGIPSGDVSLFVMSDV